MRFFRLSVAFDSPNIFCNKGHDKALPFCLHINFKAIFSLISYGWNKADPKVRKVLLNELRTVVNQLLDDNWKLFPKK